MNSLRKLFKSNDKVASVIRYLIVPVTIANKLFFNMNAYMRKKGLAKANDYRLLEQFKDINNPEKRCFIVATGPSLRIEDLAKMNNDITFSMNSIYVSYSGTDWRPTYYGIQDPLVYEKIQHEIHPEEYKAVFIGSLTAKRFHVKPQDNVFVFPLDLMNQKMPNAPIHTKFSNDIVERVYSGYNIAYSMLQVAIYMGFKEIYLLGADCDYQQPQKYFKEDKNRGKEAHFTKSFLAGNTNRFIYAYQVAKEYADNHGIKIYNATRGGKLEVFERVDFDTLFTK